ncbi:MAG: hypothetical protein QF918_11960 [Pirellulaceae bacterium]|nr:hypothetical protein [Pirellulaceae bacterium]MDP6558312.1 hypothetical protein [Pirellulaceae bacterium]MDP6718740.1 hypothetical protein [Pirellulaceae bacterium]
MKKYQALLANGPRRRYDSSLFPVILLLARPLLAILVCDIDPRLRVLYVCFV